jgi:probable F420-dependent oxidoreductase
MAAGQYTLTEAFPDRFLLGLGGHRSPRQSSDPRPLDTLRSYLDAMDQAPFGLQPNRVLAALGPQALRLSASHASGAHTYFVPVEHTAQARSLLGPEPFLAVEQAVVLGNNRDLARDHVTSYMIARHQTNNLRRLGFTDADLAGSNRLVDALTVVGHVDAVASRVRQHLDVGANHVCLQVLTSDPGRIPLAEWRELAALIPACIPLGHPLRPTM